MIAILFALPAESSDFIRLLARSASGNGKCPESIQGQIHGRSIAVFHTGVGERSCRARIENILRESQFKYLISTGFAGALNRDLKVGELLVSNNLSSPALLSSPHLDPTANRFVVGKLKTVPKIISSESERERWATESGAVAIDMETEFIAEACVAHKVPLLSLRVISDTPAEPLPAPPEILFDLEKQKTNFALLAYHLMTHPSAFKRLSAFRQQVLRARQSLTAALDKILRVDLI